MADKNLINNNFKQQGDVCVMASYATIINYFSDNNLSIDNILERYINKLSVSYFQYAKNKQKKKQESISKHFHKYCWDNGDIRGFEFIKQLHNNNELETNGFCNIVGFKAQLQSLSQTDIELIRRELEENDALAMVLYKVSDRKFHAVVIGFDSHYNSYFYKDPEKKQVTNGDILQNKDIWEYIIFNDYE